MGSTANGSSNPSASRAGAVVDKDVDFANYFCTYAYLYHQKEMLADRVRMDAYFNAVFQNKHHFQGKVQTFLLLHFVPCSDRPKQLQILLLLLLCRVLV
ncbi:hypothetical protein BHM03_00016993 [Ensete ventricosum]|nr:hypothetical protein BHM03_00016993 [Ensete ventricosum]